MNEAINSNWSTRELRRQMRALLFERLSSNKHGEDLLRLSRKGQPSRTFKDFPKNPHILEFLGLEKHNNLFQNRVKQALIDHLWHHLLELGRGFSFIARRQRITLGTDHFHIDLVLHSRLAKSFVLFGLKIGKLRRQDIARMQRCVHYYESTQMVEGENAPIGLILCAERNRLVVRSILPANEQQIFATEYERYLPTEEELRAAIMPEKNRIEMEMSLRVNPRVGR